MPHILNPPPLLPLPPPLATPPAPQKKQKTRWQVQGGAPSYRHNLKLLELFGFQPTPVDMRIRFGAGDKQWTNHRRAALAFFSIRIWEVGRVVCSSACKRRL